MNNKKPSLIKTLWQFLKGNKSTFWTDKDLFFLRENNNYLDLLHKNNEQDVQSQDWTEIVSIPLEVFHKDRENIYQFLFNYISLSISCSQLTDFLDKNKFKANRYLQIGGNKYYLRNNKNSIEILLSENNTQNNKEDKVILECKDNSYTKKDNLTNYFIDILNHRWLDIENEFRNLMRGYNY